MKTQQKDTTVSRAFLNGVFMAMNAGKWSTAAILGGVAAIKQRAADLAKPSWIYAALKLEIWLAAITNAPPFSMFTIGNSKLPFLSWSTLPGVNCPGAGDCWLNGRGYCYSLHAFRHVNAVMRWLQNTILERGHAGRAMIRRELSEVLQRPKFRNQKTVTLRLYVDGDFPNLEILKFWLEICAEFPRLRVYGYSKSLHLFAQLVKEGYKFPTNYALNGSSGGVYYGSKEHALLKEQPFYRGEFIAAPVSNKASATNRTNEERREIRAQFPGEKVFICPGLCGECTKAKTPHACGNLNTFKNVKIIIPKH